MPDNLQETLYATISLHVYRKQGATPSLPPNWQFEDCPSALQKDGYFGAAYYNINQDTKEIQVILAQRGTDNLAGTIDDFTMWLINKVPRQFNEGALPFLHTTLSNLNEKFSSQDGWKITFSNTGHSLGATLAELITAYIGSQTDLSTQYPNLDLVNGNITTCMNFDSPGSGELLDRLMNKSHADKTLHQLGSDHHTLKILDLLHKKGVINQAGYDTLVNNLQTICTDIDAINTCLTHVNQINKLTSLLVGYQWLPDRAGKLPMALKDVKGTLYWANEFSFGNQHPMQHIYDAINERKLQVPCNPNLWPSRTVTGFQAFLNFELPFGLPHFHRIWWEGYMALLWFQNPTLHQQYTNPMNEPDFLLFRSNYITSNLRKDYQIDTNAIDEAPLGGNGFFDLSGMKEKTSVNTELALLSYLKNVYAQCSETLQESLTKEVALLPKKTNELNQLSNCLLANASRIRFLEETATTSDELSQLLQLSSTQQAADVALKAWFTALEQQKAQLKHLYQAANMIDDKIKTLQKYQNTTRENLRIL